MCTNICGGNPQNLCSDQHPPPIHAVTFPCVVPTGNLTQTCLIVTQLWRSESEIKVPPWLFSVWRECSMSVSVSVLVTLSCVPLLLDRSLQP